MSSAGQKTINDVPDVVLEYIFSCLPMFDDLLRCRLVCRNWYDCVNAAVAKRKRDFKDSLKTMDIVWNDFVSVGPTISGRYSHSCCTYGSNMYIFGGCTVANTTFNDLWIFDLTTRQWKRPLVTGTYPPPKACASLARNGDTLILYGGWAHSSPHPLEWKLFNQVHLFDTKSNRWHAAVYENECPNIAGHSASILNDEMIVFGGLINAPNNMSTFISSNNLWILDVKRMSWRKHEFTVNSEQKIPPPRYGHSVVTLNDNSIAVFGGCGGPNILLNDAWILTRETESIWSWHELRLDTKDLTSSLPVIGFHPACKVDNYIVFLNKSIRKTENYTSDIRRASFQNQSRCHFQQQQTSTRHKLQPQPSTEEKREILFGSLSKPSIRPNARSNRQKRLDSLDKMEKRIKNNTQVNTITMPTMKTCQKSINDAMSLYVLDISKVLETQTAIWLPIVEQFDGPEEKVLYSLVYSCSELTMFGGITKGKNSPNGDVVSNIIHVASHIRSVI